MILICLILAYITYYVNEVVFKSYFKPIIIYLPIYHRSEYN